MNNIINFQYWGYFEYTIVGILFFYFIRGLFRPVQHSILSLTLFVVSMFAFVMLPIYLSYNVIVVNNFLGLIKVLLISSLSITLGKWFIYYILKKFIGNNSGVGFLKFLLRIPSALITVIEGMCLIVCLFWIMDYFDNLIINKFPKLSAEISSNKTYDQINKINPIYDIQGSKNLKIVLTVFSSVNLIEKLSNQSVYQKFLSLPIVRKLFADTEFQEQIQKGNFKGLLLNEFTRNFLSDEAVFELVTSSEMINSCRAIMSETQLKFIDDRKGIFSDMSLNFRNNTKTN